MIRYQIYLSALVAGLLVTTSAFAAGKHEHKHKQKAKELSAHEHGHGALNVAIDGKTLQIELEAPGADVVGFETKPETPEQKKKVADAMAVLKDAKTLFAINSEAGCQAKKVDVELEIEGSHSEFHAEYMYECARPKMLKQLGTEYFKRFPAAEELDVQVISAKGQKKLEIDAKQSLVPLGK